MVSRVGTRVTHRLTRVTATIRRISEDQVTRDALAARWSEIGDKIVKLAEECPADHYEFRPVPDVRSFGDQLRHVAFWNEYVRKTIKGEPASGDANELPREIFSTKGKVVKALRSSFDDVKGEIENRKDSLGMSEVDTLVSFIEHCGEHYGQLVVYSRLNGVVPPASR